MLEISAKDASDIKVLILSGALVAGMGLERLSQRVKSLVAQQCLKIVVNASAVTVIDSSGVGDLVASFSLVKKSGGLLKLASPTKLVREVLQIARIPNIIEIYDTEEAAIQAFSPR